MKGQISFDFLLAIVMFLLLVGFIFAVVNDFEDSNDQIIDNVEIYSVYIQLYDWVNSMQNYVGYEADFNTGYRGTDCSITELRNKIIIGNIDNNYSLDMGRVNISANNCNKIHLEVAK